MPIGLLIVPLMFGAGEGRISPGKFYPQAKWRNFPRDNIFQKCVAVYQAEQRCVCLQHAVVVWVECIGMPCCPRFCKCPPGNKRNHPEPNTKQQQASGFLEVAKFPPSKNLLPSAVHLEERLTVSQSGFFVSGRRGPKQWGGLLPQGKQWPNGTAAARNPYGWQFKSRRGKYGAAATADSRPSRIRTADQKLCVGCITIRPELGVTAICLPTAWSLPSENF